jgi:hypothetical protein
MNLIVILCNLFEQVHGEIKECLLEHNLIDLKFDIILEDFIIGWGLGNLQLIALFVEKPLELIFISQCLTSIIKVNSPLIEHHICISWPILRHTWWRLTLFFIASKSLVWKFVDIEWLYHDIIELEPLVILIFNQWIVVPTIGRPAVNDDTPQSILIVFIRVLRNI